MIGGRDIIIPISPGVEAMDVAIRAVLRRWPHALIEDAESGDTFRTYSEIDFAGRREILAFRDSKVAAQWDELGADSSLDGTLIHFLLSDGSLTVAIDASPSHEMLAFVESIRQSLYQDLFGSRVRRPKEAA